MASNEGPVYVSVLKDCNFKLCVWNVQYYILFLPPCYTGTALKGSSVYRMYIYVWSKRHFLKDNHVHMNKENAFDSWRSLQAVSFLNHLEIKNKYILEDSHWIAEKEYHFQTSWEASVIIFSLKLDTVTKVKFQKTWSRCGAWIIHTKYFRCWTPTEICTFAWQATCSLFILMCL